MGARGAFRGARVPVTRFSARTVFGGRTAFRAISGFRVARTGPVALQHGLGTADQRVAVESGHATALHSVIDDFALGARAAGGGAVTGIYNVFFYRFFKKIYFIEPVGTAVFHRADRTRSFTRRRIAFEIVLFNPSSDP